MPVSGYFKWRMEISYKTGILNSMILIEDKITHDLIESSYVLHSEEPSQEYIELNNSLNDSPKIPYNKMTLEEKQNEQKRLYEVNSSFVQSLLD